jgi:DNA-binding NarL/FixJ family response regulator
MCANHLGSTFESSADTVVPRLPGRCVPGLSSRRSGSRTARLREIWFRRRGRGCWTAREKAVCERMAEGRSNTAISEDLHLSEDRGDPISRVFSKLGLVDNAGGHRRVLAVLTYLRQGRP